MQRILPLAVPLALAVPVCGQDFTPPPAKMPDAATLKKIEQQSAKLREAVAEASKKVPGHEADLAIYVKAAEWIVKHNEWFTADSGKQTLAVIEQGLRRAEAAKEGKTPWLEVESGAVARGYRSVIDGSVQPYGVIYPHDYGKEKGKKWRLDVHLHGRDSSLTEVKHLYQHAGKEAPKDQDFVQINIYGRGNNAYRWAGEVDVFEALNHFRETDRRVHKADLIDSGRVVLKGFSMGGAGAWHIGLRTPDRFAVIQPGAGFTTTHGYIAKLPDPLPDYQEKCLSIYDAYRYAENAFNVPIVAYSGEIDKQRQAAENIQAELKRIGLSERMTHLIGPGLEHKFPPEWQHRTDEVVRQRLGASGREKHPDRVRFVTYTLKQNRCNWVEVLALDQHYNRAEVDAVWEEDHFRVRTSNVGRLRLKSPPRNTFPYLAKIDGKTVRIEASDDGSCVFDRGEGGWRAIRLDPTAGRADKHPGVQGPIDDAFTCPFLCVLGTGTPNHARMHAAAAAQLDRFRREWDKYFRGDLPVKKDTEVTDADLKSKNLVLFGDAGSNALIARALPKLPIRWTKEALEFGPDRFGSASHLPILIQSSPFANDRYVVLNSGHTFHEADFKGTNALLYPRLGDYAVVKPKPTDTDPSAFEVVTAGLFDEEWKFSKK